MQTLKKNLSIIKNNWMLVLAAVIFLASGIKFGIDRGWFEHLASARTPKTNTLVDDAVKAIHQYCENPTNLHADGGSENCYAKQFQQLAKNQGSGPAFTVLAKLQKIDPSTLGCHLIGHGIGWGTYERNPSDWQNEIQTMNPSCNYGAIHGVMEGYLNDQPDHTLNKTVIPKLCGPTPRADCNHIIGHLILVETRGNVTQALGLCTTFTDATQLDFCNTGVFMEEETALNLVDHGFADQSWLNWPARLPELTKMCLSYSGVSGEDCWTELVHVIVATYYNNPEKIFDYCSENPDPIAASRCKRHGIGIIAASHNFDIGSIKSMCDLVQKGDPTFKADCYVQLAASDLSTIPSDKDKVQSFCDSLEAQYQQACDSQVKYDTYVQGASTD